MSRMISPGATAVFGIMSSGTLFRNDREHGEYLEFPFATTHVGQGRRPSEVGLEPRQTRE
jgi:hypothetical protein